MTVRRDIRRQLSIWSKVHEGILSLSQLILGPCSIIQAALHDILHNTPEEFHNKTIEQLEVSVCCTVYSTVCCMLKFCSIIA
jgi:hypothetical protein